MRKAQVTVFIIISLIILTMVGVAYYMISATQEQKGEEQIKKLQVSAIKIDPLKEYIKSCLSITSAEGFELLGKQGGYIYRSQGGIIDDPSTEDYVDYQLTKVYYGIYKPIANVGLIFFSQTPAYPFPTFPYILNSTGSVVFSNYMRGYYGRNKIPPLLKPVGTQGQQQPVVINGVTIQAQKQINHSIQEQLEKFVINGTLECIDWSGFEMQGLNITAEAEPNISVEFAEADVSFYLKWPIQVEDRATGAVTKMDEFLVIYPVRFRRMHDFARVLMDADVLNISYSMIATDGEINSYVIPDVDGATDLVKIIDSRSNLLGEDYEYRFMRQNRPPALYYINQSAIKGPLCDGSTIALTGEENLSFIDSCGIQDFNMTFNAIDPDEEEVNFTYTLKFYTTPLSTVELSTAGSASHPLSEPEAAEGIFTLNVSVTDGEYTDWQAVDIETVVTP